MRPPVEVHDALAALLRYPRDDYVRQIDLALDASRVACPEVAALLSPFATWARGRVPGELEEDFARTFEHTDERALEVGWHVFGESYTRGTYLVTMRGLLREHGVEECGELPDHLSHAVAVVGRMAEQRAAEFCRHSFGPAARKVHEALARTGSPWTPLLATTLRLLELHVPASAWDDPRPIASVEGC